MAASCARVVPEELPKLGERCTGKCQQEPELTVYCDTRSDGAGSFRCESGGKPSPLDGYCGEANRCLEPGRCFGTRCSLPLEDGAECSAQGQCASGYCCASVYCAEGSVCRLEGTPLVEPDECTRLAELGNAVVVGAASRNVVAVNDSELYWNEGLELWHSALDGSSGEVLVSVTAPDDHPAYYPIALEVDGTRLYYLQRNGVGMFDRATGNDSWVAVGGDTATVYETSFAATEDALYVASAGCRYINVLGKDLSFGGLNSYSGDDADDNAGYIALGPDYAYCVSEAGIYAMPLTRGPLERLATLDAWGGPAVFYNGVLFFTNVDHQKPPQGTPALRAFHVSDGSIETLQVLQGMSLGLVLDGATRTLYFGNGSSIDAHEPTPGIGVEHSGSELVRSLTQSTTDLYYLTDSGIFRLHKFLARIPMR